MAERPVKLQVNTSGAWKDVAFFDAGDQAKCDQVMEGAEKIADATGIPFRIAMQDSMQSVLMRLAPGKGWKKGNR